MKILVTGHHGFIGSHLTKSLLEDGHKVLGIDDKSIEHPWQLAEKRSRLTKGVIDIPITRSDLSFLPDWYGDLEMFQDLDVIIHLGARPGVRRSLTHPHEYNNNVSAFTSILRFCELSGVPVVYASSSTVYGTRRAAPFSEDMALEADSYYGLTKIMNEQQAAFWSDVRSVALRFFTVYGPYSRPDMAIGKWTEAIQDDKPITLFTDENGEYLRRDWTYVDDIVSGIKAAAKKIYNEEELPKAINLGNNRPESIEKVVYILSDLLGKPIEVVKKQRPKSDAPETGADITLARKYLGFNPKTVIEDGLEKAVRLTPKRS